MQLAVVIILLLTAVRIMGLILARIELDFEEAQYWDWSRHFAFGYFSKPPLIGWIIDAAQRVCGSGESCIRAPAALLYGATALLVLAATRRLYEARTAMWAAILVALAPGVAFSARLMTTDVPLLFCVALTLYAIARLRERPDWRFGVLLGVALGAGMLAKYAMIYCLGTIALLAIVAPQERRWIFSRALVVALVTCAIIIAPNIGWNLQNGFSTFLHTRENIEGQGATFSALKAIAFFGTQFGLAGPILFAVFLARLFGFGHTQRPDSDRLLLVFSAPVVIGLTAYAFVVRANPNWGASGVLPAMALAAAVLVAQNRRGLLLASLGIGLLVQVALLVGDVIPRAINLPFLKSSNPYERVLGWKELAQQIERVRRQSGAKTVATEDRRHVALFTYYLRDAPVAVLAWGHGTVAKNHFEASAPLTRAALEPILFVTQCEDTKRLEAAYADIQVLGTVSDSVERAAVRRFLLVKLAQPRGEVPALPHCGAGTGNR